MQTTHNESTQALSEADQAELNKLVNDLELSSGTTTIFAVALESGPNHPVVEQLKLLLSASEDNFHFQNFFYSDNSLHNFLYSLDEVNQQVDGVRSPQSPLESEGRKVVMAFGLDQLPTPRLVREMKQFNLGRDSIFGRELVLIFWLNKAAFLDEFRYRAPDFWDWRGKVVQFEARPTRNPLLYPYLQWLIAENSYLKITGVMQVQRQVDIFLEQIYVSLQATEQQQVTEISDRSQREFEAATSQLGSKGRRSSVAHDDFELLDDFEPMMPDFLPDVTRTKTVTKKVDLAQAVRESQYSVILGAPGAGKTTLLKYLALHFAAAKRDGKETVVGGVAQEELGKSLLPIFFRIADYAERLRKQPDLSLLDYLRQFYRQWEAYFESESLASPDLDPPQPPLLRGENPVKVPLHKGDLGGSPGLKTLDFQLLLEQMRHGNCLMLLDGLDEVFDQESRRQIVAAINQFVEEFSSNKFVITSRIAGYQDARLSSRFTEFTIEDMGYEQAENFLHRWCRAIERAQQPDANEEQCHRKGDGEAQAILEAIQANEGVQRLTANPLLLTILALIHRNGSRLPNRRVELYALAVKTLTEDWQLGKKLPDASKVVLKENEVVRLLAPLAYWMHEEKPSGLVTQGEVEEKLAEKWAEINGEEAESESVRQAVEEFLRKVRETTGLFVERAPGVYGFMHLTFEEYFAARYIADNDQSDILEIIRSHLDEPRWNETILLALGYYGVHFNAQIDKLVNRLFSNLEDYKPSIQGGEITVKNGSLLLLKDLLFAGQVLAEVEVNNSIRKKLVQQLVLTLVLDTDLEDEINHKLLKRLRQIELFNQKGEVIVQLKQVANDSTFSEKVRIKAQLAILYVVCGESGKELGSCVNEVVNQLEPTLFCGLQDLFAGLGEEMTPALEKIRKNRGGSHESQTALTFLTGMSYVRTDNYEKAIVILEEINEQQDSTLSAYTSWSLATCYQQKKEFDKAIDYYQECFEKLTPYIEPSAFLLFWRNRGVCHRLHAKYEQALDCFQRMLAIAREYHKCEDESLALWHIGKVYKEWNKYEQAVDYYQQSRDLDERLGRDKSAANMWYWLADCYRDWGKYRQAVEHQEQCLMIRQQREDQPAIALAYYQLGRIYQAWGKYEQALSSYQQSRDLYEQLDREKDLANQWRNLADCYRDWGKYEQAIECQQQCLTIRQTLDDQSLIAVTYYQLGRIYKAWGKYEQALSSYQQSREFYQQLGKDKDVANQWHNLADCYQDRGKYEQAIECQQQCLTIRQMLDDQSLIAVTYYELGRIYQAWGKYEQAIAHYQQSSELFEQLGQDKDIAVLWYWLADCYRVCGKYEQAVECECKDLAIRQNLDDQKNIASAYYELGRIYQAWGKYKQAIDYYQQSRDLYEQLDREKSVANKWNNLATCYRDWSKYEQAVECHQQCLMISKKLDDQSLIAATYYQLGHCYQTWGKYKQAVAHYQQSCDLYEQLELEKNLPIPLSLLAICYLDWGKYEQAIECQQRSVLLFQQQEDQLWIAINYFLSGSLYKSWGKYGQALTYYQQSRELYEQLGKEKDVATLWYLLADCHCDAGKYEQALEYQQQCLTIRQTLDDQSLIAITYYQLGYIHQSWGKYKQAVDYHEQSRELYEQLGKEKNAANQWDNLSSCYRIWGKYEQAIECQQQRLTLCQRLDEPTQIANVYFELGRIYQAWDKYEQALSYYQQSQNLYQQLGKDVVIARIYRRIAHNQGLLAKNNLDKSVALDLLTQAEQNLRQAIQINTAGEYKGNLAYDYTELSLLWSKLIHILSTNDPSIPEKVTQFEEYYNTGLTYLTEQGEIVSRADEALDIARVYLEITALENLEKAESLAQESLQVFQEYNRRKLEALARKLLGEIYLKRAQCHQPDAEEMANKFLTESRQIYRELDISEKVTKVENLLYPNAAN